MTPSSRATEIVDLSELPDYVFGSNGIGFWGGIAFMLIEGMGFVLAIGAYFYLIPYEKQWPPSGAPPPLPSPGPSRPTCASWPCPGRRWRWPSRVPTPPTR
jgi:hypothetical protein